MKKWVVNAKRGTLRDEPYIEITMIIEADSVGEAVFHAQSIIDSSSLKLVKIVSAVEA